MYAGMTDIAAIYQDAAYLDAVIKVWDNIVNHKMYITGGVGSKHEGEAFGENDELPGLTAYNETCAAIGSVYWNHRLFQLTGDSKYYDIIERTLYNGLISGISTNGKNFFYTNPLESDGKYGFNERACTRQPWFDCSCCPTNLIRFIPSVPGLVYAINKDSLYINLFMSNTAHVKIGEKNIEISQQTDYPWNGKVNIHVNPEKRTAFTLKIRIPGWAQNQPVPGNLYSYLGGIHDKSTLRINGKEQKVNLNRGYVEITKEWRQGDTLELILPMAIREIVTNEKVKDNTNQVAFEYGPLVYCAEEIDNRLISAISIPDKIDLHIEETTILSNKIITINGHLQGERITLIPYYFWSNRGVGKMKVWFPRQNE